MPDGRLTNLKWQTYSAFSNQNTHRRWSISAWPRFKGFEASPPKNTILLKISLNTRRDLSVLILSDKYRKMAFQVEGFHVAFEFGWTSSRIGRVQFNKNNVKHCLSIQNEIICRPLTPSIHEFQTQKPSLLSTT